MRTGPFSVAAASPIEVKLGGVEVLAVYAGQACALAWVQGTTVCTWEAAARHVPRALVPPAVDALRISPAVDCVVFVATEGRQPVTE